MPRRKKDATESTSQTGKDRANARYTPKTTCADEGTITSNQEADSAPKLTPREPPKEIATTAGSKLAILNERGKEDKIEELPQPRCPKCGEQRFYDGLRGQEVQCKNCRETVVIV